MYLKQFPHEFLSLRLSLSSCLLFMVKQMAVRYFGADPPANDITQNKNSISEVDMTVLDKPPQGQPKPFRDRPSDR